MKQSTRNALTFLSVFDWISPAKAIWHHVAEGHACISIWWDEHEPAHYTKILRRRGIKVGGEVIVGGIGSNGYVITVPGHQEMDARRILSKAGAILA